MNQGFYENMRNTIHSVNENKLEESKCLWELYGFTNYQGLLNSIAEIGF